MSNDITALALLVSKAKASVFTMKYISQFEASDIDSDDVDLRFEVDGVETGTNVSIVDECGQAAQMITALVEALEKAQTERDEFRNRLKLERGILEDADKRIAELSESHSKLREGMAAIYNAICADGASTSVSAILTFVKRAHEESSAAGIQVIEGGAPQGA